MENLEYSFIAITPRPCVELPDWVSSMGQIDLFKDYSYSIEQWEKILVRKSKTKNVNMNKQLIWFSNIMA